MKTDYQTRVMRANDSAAPPRGADYDTRGAAKPKPKPKPKPTRKGGRGK